MRPSRSADDAVETGAAPGPPGAGGRPGWRAVARFLLQLAQRVRASAGSSADTGSSTSSRRRRWYSTRARPQRWSWPPERRSQRSNSRSSRPKRASASIARPRVGSGANRERSAWPRLHVRQARRQHRGDDALARRQRRRLRRQEQRARAGRERARVPERQGSSAEDRQRSRRPAGARRPADAQQRGLAGARGPDERQLLALAHAQVDAPCSAAAVPSGRWRHGRVELEAHRSPPTLITSAGRRTWPPPRCRRSSRPWSG